MNSRKAGGVQERELPEIEHDPFEPARPERLDLLPDLVGGAEIQLSGRDDDDPAAVGDDLDGELRASTQADSL